MKKEIIDKEIIEGKKLIEKYRAGEVLANECYPKYGSEDDKRKYGICQKICESYNSLKIDLDKLSSIVGCSKEQANKLVHSHYGEFTLDFLLNSLDKLRSFSKDGGSK